MKNNNKNQNKGYLLHSFPNTEEYRLLTMYRYLSASIQNNKLINFLEVKTDNEFLFKNNEFNYFENNRYYDRLKDVTLDYNSYSFDNSYNNIYKYSSNVNINTKNQDINNKLNKLQEDLESQVNGFLNMNSDMFNRDIEEKVSVLNKAMITFKPNTYIQKDLMSNQQRQQSIQTPQTNQSQKNYSLNSFLEVPNNTLTNQDYQDTFTTIVDSMNYKGSNYDFNNLVWNPYMLSIQIPYNPLPTDNKKISSFSDSKLINFDMLPTDIIYTNNWNNYSRLNHIIFKQDLTHSLINRLYNKNIINERWKTKLFNYLNEYTYQWNIKFEETNLDGFMRHYSYLNDLNECLPQIVFNVELEYNSNSGSKNNQELIDQSTQTNNDKENAKIKMKIYLPEYMYIDPLFNYFNDDMKYAQLVRSSKVYADVSKFDYLPVFKHSLNSTSKNLNDVSFDIVDSFQSYNELLTLDDKSRNLSEDSLLLFLFSLGEIPSGEEELNNVMSTIHSDANLNTTIISNEATPQMDLANNGRLYTSAIYNEFDNYLITKKAKVKQDVLAKIGYTTTTLTYNPQINALPSYIGLTPRIETIFYRYIEEALFVYWFQTGKINQAVSWKMFSKLASFIEINILPKEQQQMNQNQLIESMQKAISNGVDPSQMKILFENLINGNNNQS